MTRNRSTPKWFLALLLAGCQSVQNTVVSDRPSFSGIYPHLAYYNEEGECGTGAVVPWADRLWVVTYGPHLPRGSSDKLYEITPDLQQIVREESIGGTPANRMVHRESNQLFIGPYAIDSMGNVRTIPYERMPGRHTGNARHLIDPANKIYYGTMEEGFYSVDVHTLAVDTLFLDGNAMRKAGEMGQEAHLLPGAHGKGLYSGQGVLVYSNNGEATKEALERFDVEAGVLAEWDGNEWTTVRRNQFVEVTGPGGITGNADPDTDPIWATGWDHKSVILGVRSPEAGWAFYRLPKASHSYDGAHGWNTEWPRIRDVGTEGEPDYLMTMHGMFWRFPGTFAAKQAAGIRPRSAYLKVVGDFTRWQDGLVFGTDDSAEKEFLNKRKIKGGIEGPGQSNSNLWFTALDKPDQLGPNTASGAVWLQEDVAAGAVSEPFLFAGWDERAVWATNEGNRQTTLEFEVDQAGDGQWQTRQRLTLDPGETMHLAFAAEDKGEWIRVANTEGTQLTVQFTYTDRGRFAEYDGALFAGLADVASGGETTGGLLYGLGDNRRALGLLAGTHGPGGFNETGYYELNGEMELKRVDDTATAGFIRNQFAIPEEVVTIDEASALVVDDRGRRWRLPLGDKSYTKYIENGLLRICREVATERDLLNLHGTFYELPAENADGFAKVRPVASHGLRIHDYASYRGLLVMTGVDDETENEHIIRSDDGQASVWVGAIDDLWKLGKPVGQGGPWKDSDVQRGVASDPYLIGFYDHRELELSHDGTEAVTFRIEVEPVGHGPWMTYEEVTVEPGGTFKHVFLDEFQARWIRFVSDRDCKATAWLTYR
ncbi:hypothetical protein ACFOET_11715 [Parapedobacter deserti]|uniref:Uncharacterized protein n=1 Tax=Parapedobacter deserti TaxID=1912957 RepID=A0ABV7JN12_9SPHI